MFSRVIPSGVLGGALPTLKTGNGESRSWVRIPPHPLGFSRDPHEFGSARAARQCREQAPSRLGGYAAEDASYRTEYGNGVELKLPL